MDSPHAPSYPEHVREVWKSLYFTIQHFKNHRKEADIAMQYAKNTWRIMNFAHGKNDVANVAIGLGRMICETQIAGMTAARPGFSIANVGQYPKGRVKLWQDGIDFILSQNKFEMTQRSFMRDYTVCGYGAYDVKPQLPSYVEKIDKGNWDYDERIRFDLSQPRLEIKTYTPWQVWADPASPTIERSRRVYTEEVITFAEFKMQYAVAKNSDGTQKYKYCEYVKPGYQLICSEDNQMLYRDTDGMAEKVAIGTFQDEIANMIYIIANGVLIYMNPLRAIIRDGKMIQSGLNVLGKHSVCFGGNNDTYDTKSNTASLYPMGEPEKLKQLEKIYNLFAGITVDNWKMANSFVLYGPGMDDLDLDRVSLYSGVRASGEVGVANLGSVDLSKYQYIVDQLESWGTIMSGSNFKQITGDPSRTATEQALKREAQTRTWEDKTKALEDGCYSKLGSLCLAGLLTEYSSEDWEEMTETEVTMAKKSIKNKKSFSGDYKFAEDMKSGKKRVYYTMPVKNSSVSEDFSKGESRGADTIKGVLEYSKQDSLFPVVKEYLWHDDFAIDGRIPDVIASGFRSIQSSRTLRTAQLQTLSNYIRERLKDSASGVKGGETNLTLSKLDDSMVSSLGFDPEEFTKDEQISDLPDLEGVDKQIDAISGESETLTGQIPPLPTPESVQSPTAPTAGQILTNPLAHA